MTIERRISDVDIGMIFLPQVVREPQSREPAALAGEEPEKTVRAAL